MKKDIIKNIFIITLFFIFVLLFINIFSMFANIKDIKENKYYFIGNDKIPSIYNIVGKRKLYKYKATEKDKIYTNIYKYKNIENVKSDLSKYTRELRDNYNYIYTSNIDFTNDNGEISLSTNSVDKDSIIIIKITYSKDKYEINITKGKGNIKYF